MHLENHCSLIFKWYYYLKKNLYITVIGTGAFQMNAYQLYSQISWILWAKCVLSSPNLANLTPLCHTNINLRLFLHHFSSFLASISHSDLSSTEQSEHGFQSHKLLAALLIQPLVPPLTLGPGLMLTSHVENSQAQTGITHGKYWGLQGDMGWRMIRLDALHLSLWIQD